MKRKNNESNYESDNEMENGYDSDEMTENIEKFNSYRQEYHYDEEEDDIFEDDEEEKEDQVNVCDVKKLEIDKSREMMKNLNLDGKLNWVNWKSMQDQNVVDVVEFPLIANKPKFGPYFREPKFSSKFKPSNIRVVVGNRTFIEFRSIDFCKNIINFGECKFGKSCRFLHCIPQHVLTSCKFGSECKNTDCKRNHPSPVAKCNSATSSDKERELKKHILCKKNCIITKDKIVVTNKCNFGEKCIFAHSWTEVRDANIQSCKFDVKCKRIVIELFKKNDAQGRERLVRKYKQVEGGLKCFKLHDKERIVDYIIRTQGITEA